MPKLGLGLKPKPSGGALPYSFVIPKKKVRTLYFGHPPLYWTIGKKKGGGDSLKRSVFSRTGSWVIEEMSMKGSCLCREVPIQTMTFPLIWGYGSLHRHWFSL